MIIFWKSSGGHRRRRINYNIALFQISDDIRDWAIEFDITHKALTRLLHILKRHEIDVPVVDARTFLNTPRPHSYDVKTFSRGQYIHYGLGRALTTIINQTPQAFLGRTVIQLDLNIDGLPIAKSSKSQLWPILGKISDLQQPFLIGAYHGYSKAPLSEFLQPFVDEYTVLQTNKFEVNGLMYQIQIRAIICDSPARAYVTCTKSHNAYFGCGKCTVKGTSINRRMTFTELTLTLKIGFNHSTIFQIFLLHSNFFLCLW